MVSKWAEICISEKHGTSDFAYADCMPVCTVRSCKEISRIAWGFL